MFNHFVVMDNYYHNEIIISFLHYTNQTQLNKLYQWGLYRKPKAKPMVKTLYIKYIITSISNKIYKKQFLNSNQNDTLIHRHGFLTTVALRTSQSHTHLNSIRYYNQTHLLGKKYIFNIKPWIIISSISKYITLCKKKRRKKIATYLLIVYLNIWGNG